jgi:hypothetical protein
VVPGDARRRRREGARVHGVNEAYGCTHGDPCLEARSGVEAMSLGPESLTRTLCTHATADTAKPSWPRRAIPRRRIWQPIVSTPTPARDPRVCRRPTARADPHGEPIATEPPHRTNRGGSLPRLVRCRAPLRIGPGHQERHRRHGRRTGFRRCCCALGHPYMARCERVAAVLTVDGEVGETGNTGR